MNQKQTLNPTLNPTLNQTLKKKLEFWTQSGVEVVMKSKKKNSQIVLNSNTTLTPQLTKVREEIGDCTRCKLHKGRTNIVFGAGNPNADLMFVGEAPGADEDLQGIPFIGRAGQLLTKMIEAMGLTREDIYIANVVKCRPPENRNPDPDEVSTCQPFLKKQIEAINPKVVVALGKFAAQTLLQTEIPITKLRGEFHSYGNTQLMPTYHPAYLLRNPSMKKAVWEDLQKVMQVLGLSLPTQK